MIQLDKTGTTKTGKTGTCKRGPINADSCKSATYIIETGKTGTFFYISFKASNWPNQKRKIKK